MFDGNVSISQIPVERSLDIDTKFDLKIAKILMKNEKNKTVILIGSEGLIGKL